MRAKHHAEVTQWCITNVGIAAPFDPPTHHATILIDTHHPYFTQFHEFRIYAHKAKPTEDTPHPALQQHHHLTKWFARSSEFKWADIIEEFIKTTRVSGSHFQIPFCSLSNMAGLQVHLFDTVLLPAGHTVAEV